MPDSTITPGSSLALIGNPAEQTLADVSIRGVFDKKAGRKPLAFAADRGTRLEPITEIVAPTG
jgi:hypothetical protein